MGLVSHVSKLRPVPGESESVTLLPLCLIAGRGLSPKDQVVPAPSVGRLPVFILSFLGEHLTISIHIVYVYGVQSLRASWHSRE